LRWFSNASVKQTFEKYDLRRPTVPPQAALARLFSARNGTPRNEQQKAASEQVRPG